MSGRGRQAALLQQHAGVKVLHDHCSEVLAVAGCNPDGDVCHWRVMS